MEQKTSQVDKIKIKRALISVSDKSGIESLAKTLHAKGCEIISTGGTKKVLELAGIPVTEISKVTGNPEAFGGRMKTIPGCSILWNGLSREFLSGIIFSAGKSLFSEFR